MPYTPAVEERGSTTRRRLLLAAVVTLSVLPFPYFEGLNNPNEQVRLYMTMALVEQGTLAIDEPTRRFGWVNDRAEREGHLYAGKAPGASLLGVPVYALLRQLVGPSPTRAEALRWLRLGAVTLPSLLFLIALRRFFDELDGSPWLRDALWVAYALGSMALAYGMMFAGHQLAAVCLGSALIAFFGAARRLDRGGGGARWRALLGGLLLGASPAMEYPATIPALFVGLYAALTLGRRAPRLLGGAFGTGLLPVALLLWVHQVAFGSPLAVPYDFIENPAFQQMLGQGWHGATAPRLDRLAAILLAPSFGLLFFTPPLLLAPLGWVAAARRWRNQPPHRRLLLIPVALGAVTAILYLSSSALWRAGWAVGPRYIASAVPLLAIAALWGAAALQRRWPRTTGFLVALLTVLAVAHAGSSGVLYPHQPEVFDNPVYDLNAPLIALGFAPHTALEPLGLFGYPALAVLGLLALVALGPILVGPGDDWTARLVHLIGVVLVSALCLAALAKLGEHDEAERRAWALVMRHWEPRGHSLPERRLEALEELEHPTAAQLRRGARAAEALGRDRQARSLRRRASRRHRERTRPSSDQLLLPSLGQNPTWGAEK